ncbi:MAG: DUF6908 domain-containing protein [Pseudobacter sp.]|uniref:DUF6908 domain-containing protein n=1 Tax=Pseudobacter sp. TaxID=2045420 RepID=UPI003F805A46
MKTLPLQPTIPFSKMLDRLGSGIFIRLKKAPFHPVKIRVLDNHFQTTEGEGKLCVISHTYDEYEGLISSMELTFIVTDNRKTATDYENLLIWPVRYEHDNLDLDLISIEIFDDGTYIPVEKYYDSNLEIAAGWLLEFEKKGFI